MSCIEKVEFLTNKEVGIEAKKKFALTVCLTFVWNVLWMWKWSFVKNARYHLENVDLKMDKKKNSVDPMEAI